MTRCCVRIYDRTLEYDLIGAVLDHPLDGGPKFMLPKLNRFLRESWRFLQETGNQYQWNSSAVAASLIMLSAEDYQTPLRPFSTVRQDRADHPGLPYRPHGGMPVFRPIVTALPGTEFHWKVFLTEPPGSYDLSCTDEEGTVVELADYTEHFWGAV